MSHQMTKRQQEFIDELIDRYDLTDRQLDELAEFVTAGRKDYWLDLNVEEASELIGELLDGRI